MNTSVNDNIFGLTRRIFFVLGAFAVMTGISFEISGQNVSGDQKIKIPAFSDLLKRPVVLKPELNNVHPRLFFTSADVPKLAARARGVDRDLWQETLKDIKSLERVPPDPADPELYKSGLEQKRGSISQYSFAFEISQTSFAYLIEGDEKYLEAARAWTLAACEMPIWGYTYNKPNVDLPPAHLLYAVAFAYDTLFDKLSPIEKTIIRNKLVKQARLMYDYFKYKPDKKYTYSQNHTWIPMAGLAVTAYVLLDEVEESRDWAKLSRAVFDRTMLTFGTDGYFYESFHYYGFAFRWMIRYFDLHLHSTGENLYTPMRDKFAGMKYFVMHSILPDRENIFDFADTGDGSLNRTGAGKREKLYGEYDILYRFAAVYGDAQAQTSADFVRSETSLGTREPMWAFINHNPDLAAAPISAIPTKVHFIDNDTIFWRSNWTKNATAFAFRSSPPEGHHAARLASLIPDWRENTGHAHPDANSFIIYANGKYLTGDTGYLGIKQTDDHNTILVNGRGQANDGVYEMFKGVSNELLDKIRIARVYSAKEYFYIRGEAASGYYPELGLKKFDRHFLYVSRGYFLIWDELETDKPADFTFLLNADRQIILDGKTADLINQDATLRVIRISPDGAVSRVVPQMVQARGLPGSVSQGDKEQRGVQLQSKSAEKKTRFEFLHFLQPVVTGEQTPAPTFERTSQGMRIFWEDGDEDFVDFQNIGQMVEKRRQR